MELFCAVVTVRFYLLLRCGRTAPEVNQEEDSYALCFYRWFSRSCLLLLVSLPRLIDTLAQLLAPSCLWRVYDCLWVVTKVLDTESFPQHNIASLISGITFIVSFSQEKPLRWKGIHTHTHTHTHTRTHAHTHTHTHTRTRTLTKGGITSWKLIRRGGRRILLWKRREGRATSRNKGV